MDSWDNMADRAFRKFLVTLSEDEDRAGYLYEDLRLRLTRFFRLRGIYECDEAADETIDRVVRKHDEGTEIGDYLKYSYGVARLVALELHRKSRVAVQAAAEMGCRSVLPHTDAESLLDYLQECLKALDDENRGLVLEYYSTGSKDLTRRELLAQRSGLNLNTLRLRIFRVKKKLEKCINSQKP